MANKTEKHPLNTPGDFYCDLTCTDCGLCPEIAPQFFGRDDESGYSYVFKQPQNEEESELALEALNSYPTESIGNDG